MVGKPPLTHFLCLPLINRTSIPQLVASLEEFRASIPLVSNPAASRSAAAGYSNQIPLLPDGAIRPLGTLHLTLGVMSLTTHERLDDALNFLQSLDVASMMRDAVAGNQAESRVQNKEAENGDMSPLTVNLSSLHALPNARSATILHAQPVDPTSRLYPFCVILRNKFIEAGFIHQEMIKGKGGDAAGNTAAPQATPSNDGQDNSGSAEYLPTIRNVKTSQTSGSLRPRPLLLHATIANTVYLGRRWTQGRGEEEPGGRGGARKKKKENYKFDARELLARFAEPSPQTPGQQHTALSRKAIPRNQPVQVEEGVTAAREEGQQQQSAKKPFVWARDIPLDRLCICEMGAKPVPYDESTGGPELGQEYKVIGERSLDFLPMSTEQ